LNVARQGGVMGQFAVGGNQSAKSMGGAQLAVGTNWTSGDFEGFQGAVGLNMVQGTVQGMQTSVGLNWADTARGVQLSLLNVGGDVSGLQLGLINVAGKMNGLQLGLVNVTRELESGVPLGLVSIVQNGQFHVEAYGSDAHFANVAIKVGSRHFYTTVVAGMGHVTGAQGPSHWSVGLGLGAHIPATERLFFDVDAVTSSVHPWDQSFTATHLLHQVRVMGGFQLAKRFAIIGGPTMNLLHSPDGEPVTALSSFSRQGPKHFIWWPGMQLGVRL
ncbi:LA_2272 family surface repeat-containing protein, partial [Pyxidicoccus sp. 3LG]